MKTEYIILKETNLNNNCPECYSTDGMILSFKQKKVTSKFLIKTKGNVIESIKCNKCESQIFHGQWTKDIERVYDYHKKTITSKPATVRFTGLFYGLFFLTLLIAVGAYLYIYNPEILGLKL